MQCQHATAPQLNSGVVWPLLLFLFDTTSGKILSDVLFEKSALA